MGDGRLRRVSWVLVVPAAIAGLAACSGGGGHPAGATASASADKAVSGGYSGTELKGALLTKVNGVGAAQAATTGKYASLSGAGATATAGTVTVTPKACAGPATKGFDPPALAGAQAAAVTFKVAGNEVSEVLVASAAKAASAALAGHVPAQCDTYQEKADGKTVKYTLTEKSVAGIGKQARELNLQAVGTSSGNSWSLIYRGAGFVGTVTVTGPNASEKAVRELGQQAYAFAAKSLS
jgi:hypothetical protein